MSTIVLVPNPLRDRDFSVTLQAAKILQAENFTCVGVFPPFPLTTTSLPILTKDEAFSGAFAAISFGGDGSLIHCAKMAAPYGVPVLGVNMGHTGFLTYISPDRLDMLRCLSSKRYTIHNRMALNATITNGRQNQMNMLAVNDIVISRSTTVKSISLEVRTENHTLGSFFGDGLIVSAATGSTGYALSAGGPVVDPDLDALLVTPICAHTTYAHPFVLSPDRKIIVSPPKDFLDDYHDTYLSLDGGPPELIMPGESAEITRSETEVQMLIPEGCSFFDQVRTKIHRI